VDFPPSPKSQAYVSASPSPSAVPAEENFTFSGATPEVLFEDASAIGERPPVAFSMR
jgi:hypothetical protein